MILLIGNWKMAPEKIAQAEKLAKETSAIARSVKKKITTISCVPSLYLSALKKKTPALLLGAQTVSAHDTIAHTSEISAAMLKNAGAQYCLVGHSEVRAAGETNELTAQKVLQLLGKNIIPIVCVGESERDDHGWYLSTIKDQLAAIFTGLAPEKAKKIIIAYEPIWAIGSKAVREATPQECHEMMLFIRKVLTDHYGEKVAKNMQVLYGGSVNEINAPLFIYEGEADGLLVGRVSLESKRFALLAKKISDYVVSK